MTPGEGNECGDDHGDAYGNDRGDDHGDAYGNDRGDDHGDAYGNDRGDARGGDRGNDPSQGQETDRDRSPWPTGLRGVTETVVATLGPNDRWNHAALGLHGDGFESSGPASGDADRDADTAADTDTPADTTVDADADDDVDTDADAVLAFTYGNTRTRRNLHREGEGVVQFTPDPVDFVDAALGIVESEDRVLDSASAWVRVEATHMRTENRDGTTVERWRLEPIAGDVRETTVPVINRGHAAVVEATVAASRLGVPGFDDETLQARLDHALDVTTTCGGPREHLAIRRVAALTDDWSPPEAALQALAPDTDLDEE